MRPIYTDAAMRFHTKKAPLLTSMDPLRLSDEMLALLLNEKLMQLHRDPLVQAAHRPVGAPRGPLYGVRSTGGSQILFILTCAQY